MLKVLGFILLSTTLIASLFGIWGAELNNQTVAIAIMLLLIVTIGDLKEFDFWGLKGKKDKFKDLPKSEAIPTEKIKPSKEAIDEAETKPIQLMDTAQGNFIALAFEIERLLRIFATVMLAKDIPQNINAIKLTKELHEKSLLTDSGVKQLEAIRWLRNIIIHGRQSEINEATLDAGIEVAYNLYQELRSTLNPEPESKQS